MKIAELKAGLQKWVAQNVGRLTVFADQNAPRPQGPYASLKLKLLPPVNGYAVTCWGSAEEPMTLVGDLPVIASVNLYRGDVMEAALLLRSSLQKVTVRDALALEGGLVYVRDHGVQELTLPVDDQVYEPRANLDIEFRTGHEITDEPGIIASVGIEGMLNGVVPVSIYAGDE